MDTSNVSSAPDSLALAHSTAVFICTLWSPIFFGFYLSFIVFFIRPLSGGDKRRESGESRVGEGGGVNAHIAPTSSFEVVALYFFLFMHAIGDIKVGQLLNPGMRIYDGVFVIIPRVRWLINSRMVNSRVLW